MAFHCQSSVLLQCIDRVITAKYSLYVEDNSLDFELVGFFHFFNVFYLAEGIQSKAFKGDSSAILVKLLKSPSK